MIVAHLGVMTPKWSDRIGRLLGPPRLRPDGRWEARVTVFGRGNRDAYLRDALPTPDEYLTALLAEFKPPIRIAFPSGPCVYVARKRDGSILYVGSSGNVISRIGDHARCSWWFTEAETWEFYGCATRADAFAAERRMIEVLRPSVNGSNFATRGAGRYILDEGEKQARWKPT